MNLQIEGAQQLRAPRERVHQALTDPQILQRCIPGCERVERTGENTYSATIRIEVGSINEVFNASVLLEKMRAPEHYRIVVEGKGTSGFMEGSGDLGLEEQRSTTIATYTGDIQVGGTVASVDQRKIQGTAKLMACQFFTAIGTEARTMASESPARQGLFRTILKWFSG